MAATGYFKTTLEIGGNEQTAINARFISCLAADDEFEIEASDGSKMLMAQGLSYLAGDGVRFERVRLRNLSVAANTVRLAFGDGELRDQRLSVSGQVQVVNEAGGTIDISTPAPIDVSAATVNVAQVAPLDVSAAVVVMRRDNVTYQGGGVTLAAGSPGNMAVPAGAQWADVENQGTERVFLVADAAATAGTFLCPGEVRRVSPVGDAVYLYNPASIAVLCRMTAGG